MNVYVDTGVFFDYLIYRSHAGTTLRKKTRRGRTLVRLYKDATSCFDRINRSHSGMTSTLTLYELEHAVFTELHASTKNITHKLPFLISSARAAVVQGITVTQLYNIRLIDLTPATVARQLAEISLQTKGIQAADSLHIVTAIIDNAEVIISTDKCIHNLDNQYVNQAGNQIRCVDTDTALTIL